ncbi:hypothetical protein MHK_010819, partial [Candidatus Magnetomorum sp. HK-1]
DKNIIEACYESAEYLLNSFENEKEKNEKRQGKVIVKTLDNNDSFPQHVIIIGDIVYTIVSYGLPYFDNEEQKFKGIDNLHKLADLVTWRRVDSVLAETIVSHLECISKNN